VLVGEDKRAMAELCDTIVDGLGKVLDSFVRPPADRRTAPWNREDAIHRVAVSNALRSVLTMFHLWILRKLAPCEACAEEFVATREPAGRLLDALERALGAAVALEVKALAERECRHGGPGPGAGREGEEERR